MPDELRGKLAVSCRPVPGDRPDAVAVLATGRARPVAAAGLIGLVTGRFGTIGGGGGGGGWRDG